ncbi:MAG: hypothetical protein IMF02_06610 [Proteobacteria bacterium]|nr:hypothetical protein [Pseudomonadota bacterium]
MSNIISFTHKKGLAEEKQASLKKWRKVQAVRKVFQCTHCALKCEKCGAQISGDSNDTGTYQRKLNVPYNFCDECSDEYQDYIERLKGAGDPDCYWHNEAWIDAWKKWIDYQSSVDQYLKSKEFKQLLNELKQTGPDE